ncbi:nuclear transport factor 2 family protein [Cupriavidus sp. 2MCAB6]
MVRQPGWPRGLRDDRDAPDGQRRPGLLLQRQPGKQPPRGGAPQEAWVRATVCFRKIGGQWLVVHEHASVPISFNPSA